MTFITIIDINVFTLIDSTLRSRTCPIPLLVKHIYVSVDNVFLLLQRYVTNDYKTSFRLIDFYVHLLNDIKIFMNVHLSKHT